MGDEEKKKKKKKKKQSKKEDDDTTNLFSAFTCAQLRKRLGNLGLKQDGLKSAGELVARLCEFDRELAAAGVDEYEGLAAAIAAADEGLAAALTAAAADAAAAAALPPIILEGRFEGYMSPRHVTELKLQIGEYYDTQAQHDFDRWQDDVTDALPVQFMRRHMLLTAIRSKRTGDPSEPAATAAAAAADDTSAAVAAAAAAADDISAAAAAAAAATAAATNAAATTIARLEHELGEMVAAAAAATAATAATTNAAATATGPPPQLQKKSPGSRRR